MLIGRLPWEREGAVGGCVVFAAVLEEKDKSPVRDAYLQETILGDGMKCGPLHMYVVSEPQREMKCKRQPVLHELI